MKSDLSKWVDTLEAQEREGARGAGASPGAGTDVLLVVGIFLVGLGLIYVVMEAACGWC